jgi:hypothetical protein
MPNTPTQVLAKNVLFRQGTNPARLDGLAAWSDAGTVSVTLVDGVGSDSYDAVVLRDRPIGYWAVNAAGTTEPDLSGKGQPGVYSGGTPARTALPNGQPAALFDGQKQYLRIPSMPAYSVAHTGNLTVEGWIRPSVLQFPNTTSDGWLNVWGKGLPGKREFALHMYSQINPESRENRISGYIFNNIGWHGSGAYFQPAPGVLRAGDWLHVVVHYSTKMHPPNCAAGYPGHISIFVNGVEWRRSPTSPTGCMSQYSITPTATDSPVDIGSLAGETAFTGAIARFALYPYLLSPAQIANHFRAMTGKEPSGSCTTTCTF